MAFNREERRTDEWRWDGTQKVAHELYEHGRDDAGLRYFQPPNRYTDLNGADYRPARLRVQLAAGHGEEWQIVPLGAIVRKGGTPAEPEFRIVHLEANA